MPINCEHIDITRIKPSLKGRPAITSGFTLIEVLVAVFILAVVVSIVMASFNGIFSDADHLTMGTDLHEMGSACIRRITGDLESIYALPYPRYRPPDIDDAPEIYHVKGEVHEVGGQSFGWLRFASLAHLAFNHEVKEGIAEIVYYVQETEENGFILRRADKLYPYPEEFEESETDPIVCEQVRHFDIVYYDAEGEEHDEWDSQDRELDYGTPRAIAIKISAGTEETHYDLYSQIALPVFRYKPAKR